MPELRSVYCGTIAYEIEHLSSHEQRVWLREAIESRAFWHSSTPEEQTRNLIRLLRVEGFEHFLKRTYLGAKQFSIEGTGRDDPDARRGGRDRGPRRHRRT